MLALQLRSVFDGSGRLGRTISEDDTTKVDSSKYSSFNSVVDKELDIAPSPMTACASSSLMNTMQCFSEVWGMVSVTLLKQGLRRMTSSTLFHHGWPNVSCFLLEPSSASFLRSPPGNGREYMDQTAHYPSVFP